VKAERAVGADLIESEFAINELILNYWKFAKNYYAKEGNPTKELTCMQEAIRPLRQLYGHSTQHSSSEWIRQAIPGLKAICLDSPDTVLNELPRLHDEADYVVADGPGSQTEISRALLLRADFAVVPCKASMLEVRALAKATEVLRQAQDIRNGLPRAVAVLSMVGQNYRLTRDMKEAADALELPLASSPLTLRQIYADAPGQSAVVWKLGAKGRDAARENRIPLDHSQIALYDSLHKGTIPIPLRRIAGGVLGWLLLSKIGLTASSRWGVTHSFARRPLPGAACRRRP